VTGTSLLPLSTLADTIKAHIAAGDKAFDKSEQHYKSAGIHLKEAKDKVSRRADLTWQGFLFGQCGLKRSRADELIAIADGRKTLEEVRAGNRERDSRRRERQSSAVAHGKSSEKAQRDQSSPPDEDAPLRLPSDDEMKRIYDGAPEEVRSAVDAFLSLRRKDRDTAWQLINLYDQLVERPDKAALAALRKRAQALGHKTIHRRGNDYWIVNADGERTQGGTGLDLMGQFLDDEEAFRAGAVRVYSTHCGKPVSAHDINGEVALDDPRAVAAFSRLAAEAQSELAA
jgi:hypothetical protein